MDSSIIMAPKIKLIHGIPDYALGNPLQLGFGFNRVSSYEIHHHFWSLALPRLIRVWNVTFLCRTGANTTIALDSFCLGTIGATKLVSFHTVCLDKDYK